MGKVSRAWCFRCKAWRNHVTRVKYLGNSVWRVRSECVICGTRTSYDHKRTREPKKTEE